MARVLRMQVVTVGGPTLSEEAVSVRVPGERGDVGILYNHAPLVSVLRPGKLIWKAAGGSARAVRIGAGLLEVTKNRVMILTDSLAEDHKPPAA